MVQKMQILVHEKNSECSISLRLCLFFNYHIQVHSRAAGGAGEQCFSDRWKHAVPRDEGESGARAAGHEALPVTL